MGMRNKKSCSFPDCGLPVRCKDLCRGHYDQHGRANGKPLRPLGVREVKLCSFPDCGRKHFGRGLCMGHLQQRQRRQELRDLWSRPSTEERFWESVNKDGSTLRPELGPCWEWTGARLIGGGQRGSDRPRLYGNHYLGFSVDEAGKKTQHFRSAHKFSWELHHGPVTVGLYVLHRCDNPPCVNPAHLFLGSAQDNVDDMLEKGRAGWQKKRRAALDFEP
jgi:hypothetical protein